MSFFSSQIKKNENKFLRAKDRSFSKHTLKRISLSTIIKKGIQCILDNRR